MATPELESAYQTMKTAMDSFLTAAEAIFQDENLSEELKDVGGNGFLFQRLDPIVYKLRKVRDDTTQMPTTLP